MFYFVDGDNVGRSGISGIRYLDGEDHVLIYHNDNGYFASDANQNNVKNATACSVVFVKAGEASNAADFACMRDASAYLSTERNGAAILVSRDNHFRTIVKQLGEAHPKAVVMLAETVLDGYRRTFLLQVTDIDGLKNALRHAYGQVNGERVFTRLARLFLDTLN